MRSSVAYKIKNWSEYNKNLIKRGNITIYFEESIAKQWSASQLEGKKGRPFYYSDSAIECALTLRSLYHLPLRATQGFLEGLRQLLGIEIKIPNYTTLCRRAKNLSIDLGTQRKEDQNIDIVIDSTGLKVYGEGEWKIRTHGKQKRRTWRKLHIAIDPHTHQTISMELTHNNVHDSKILPHLLKGQQHIKKVYADGAYIYENCFNAIEEVKAQAVIPMRSGTALVENASPALEQRNKLVRETWACGGKEQWKKRTDYHKRSLVETQMYRFKTIFGEKIQSREFKNQLTETKLKLAILNKMTNLGMPITQRIA